MQGYTWSSNQHPPPQYQGRAPPQYQGRAPPQYQARAPPQYQERDPPQYQERAPPLYQPYPLQYQDQFPPDYQDFRKDQPNMFQAQFNAQFARPSMHGYNTQTNRAHPQSLCAASNTQQHYPSENPNTYRCYAQFVVQSNSSSPQNYRNTGHNQAHMYWSPQSDHGSSVGNNRGWSSHTSMNNQQQIQPLRTAPRHQQHQFSKHHSGKQHKSHHRTQGHRQQSSHNNGVSKRISNNKAPSQTTANYIVCNPTTQPSATQSDISFPSNNLNQSPVTQNQPELRSNVGPDVSTIQFQNNQSTGQPSQGTNCGTHNANETPQMTQTNEAQPQNHSRGYANTLIYRLLCSNGNGQVNKQQSVEGIAHQNTCSEQSKVCATNRTDQHSKEPSSDPSAQCTVEPPSKRMKYPVQRDYWNKETSVSKDFGAQSVQPGTHQVGSNENRFKGMSQHSIQYSTDPADCLEAVFALQKVSQQVHKAIAIVPPISQQTSSTTLMADTNPKKADSPPLKIDYVWTLVEDSDAQKFFGESNAQTVEESDAQKTDDKLPESPLPAAHQEDKSLETETTSNIAVSDTCSTSPVECQNNTPQDDCDSSDASLGLSNVPVVKYTLEKLMDLVKSLEIAELSSGCPVESESFFNGILKLYWNGSQDNLVEALKSFRKEAEQHSSVDIVWDYETVVFESIETENLKKLAYCHVLNNEMYSLSEEFRSSWLNVNGQPADIEKVLSEPLLDDITVIKATSQVFSDKTVITSTKLGVNSHKDVPEVSSTEKSVKPDTCSPAALLTPQSGNDREEMATENNGLSYAGMSRMTHLSSVSSEKEAFKKQVDINQNNNFNTQPSDNSPAERSTDTLTVGSNEVFRQDHSEQTCHNLSVSESLPLSPGNSISDGVKKSDISFSTETLCNSKDIWQMEDISDDDNSGNKEALNKSSDIGLVEDISDAENSGNKEVLPISSDISPAKDISDTENSGNEVLPNSSENWQVEDISEDENTGIKEVPNNSSDTWPLEDISDAENSGKEEIVPNSSDIWLVDVSDTENTGNKAVLPNSSEIWLVEDISEDENTGTKAVLPNSSDTWQVEDISEDENPGNKDTCSNSSDICVKEDVSNDENSSDSLLMEITVLSSEDAKTFFQQLENEPECVVKTTTSTFDCQDLVACFDAPSQPNHEYSKADTCSLCGTKIAISNSTNVMDNAGDHLCSQCWEQAPLFELAEEPCSPVKNEAGVLASSAKSNKQGQDCSPQCLKLEVIDVASAKECIVYERLTEHKSDYMVRLGLVQNSPTLELKVKEINVPSPETCTVNEGQKRDSIVKSELEDTCCPPCLDLQVKKPAVASLKESIGNKICDGMVKSELGQTRSPPPLDLKVKELTVTSTKKCIADEKRDCMVKSELRQNRSSPSLEPKVNKPTVASTEDRINDEGWTEQKSQRLLKSELRQHCSPPSLELQVKMPNVSPPEEFTENNKRLTGLKRDCMVKSSLELEVNEPTAASTDECTEDERVTGQKKSESLLKSQLRQDCSPSPEPQIRVPNVASPKKCFADEGLEKSEMQKVPEIQRPAEQELTKIQPNKQKNDKTEKNRFPKPQLLFKYNKPPKKSAFFKHKLKSGSIRTGSDDSVLFTPDIVVKMNLPQKKKHLKRPSDESQGCSKVKKFKEHRQERQDYPDRTSQNHSETLQKVTEKVPGHSNDTPPHGSKNKLELRGILSVNKTKTIEPKKVRFDLYGSNREKQIYAHERRFSAPASLTVSDTCKDYTDVLSAKQKVLNQWSSTFIPKTKSFHPRSPQEGAPQKKKTQKKKTPKNKPQKNKPQKKKTPKNKPQKKKTTKKKPQKTHDLLKASISALKSHLTHRANLLSSSEKDINHFRKPVFHQKLTKTLSS